MKKKIKVLRLTRETLGLAQGANGGGGGTTTYLPSVNTSCLSGDICQGRGTLDYNYCNTNTAKC
jgi:hypothetical protein